MDTEEMYRRGVEDAARDDLQPFYYQHYYHYRRGYDAQRRRLGRRGPRRGLSPRGWMLLVALLAVAAVVGTVVMRNRAQSAAVSATPAPTSRPTAAVLAAVATKQPIFPTATPAPTPLALHPGGKAKIAEKLDAALRGRKDPSLKSPVVKSFKPGEAVNVVEGPIEADGYTWWKLEAGGVAAWSAQQSQDGVVWVEPVE